MAHPGGRKRIQRTFVGQAGASLAADVLGEGLPVILLHGGGQTRQSWGDTARRLAAEGYQAIALDARGHGESDWSDAPYSLEMFAADLGCVIAEVGGAPAIVGASLGGLTGLAALGSDAPPPASALVLVDIVTRSNPKGVEAVAAFMSAHPDGFASVEEAAEAVSRFLTHRPRPSNVSGLRRNLRERDGRLYWHWDPRFLTPDDTQEAPRRWTEGDLDAAASKIKTPTLVVRGERSEVVDETAIAHMRSLMPHMESAIVPGAAHMVAGDANSPFAGAALAFLKRVYPVR